MKPPLDQLEARLQALIENSLSLLTGLDYRHLLLHDLAEEMQANLTIEDEVLAAPVSYTLRLHPANLNNWQANPQLLLDLENALVQTATEAGVSFTRHPVIRLVADDALLFDEARIEAIKPGQSMGETAALETIDEFISPRKKIIAFLILKGSQTYPLKQPTTNLGRRPENHVIIDDPRVSRSHAQIREIRGQYVLFDLNSTGGTFVNEQRITRSNLKAGDVISLAGFQIIYGEESAPMDGNMSTGHTDTLHASGNNPSVPPDDSL